MNPAEPKPPMFSVVLVTRNGAAVIGDALESLLEQSLPPQQFEIVVVNNGSTEGTAQMVQEFQSRAPGRIRLIAEPVPGLSRGRNTGVRASRGEIAAFFDDDARASRGWLEALCPAFDSPQAGAAGGPIDLEWICERPAWWQAELDSVQGRLDYGSERTRLRPPRLLYGSNLAVRRSVLARVGLFREALGREGSGLLAGEEVELQLRILQAGAEIIYEPQARVTHLALARRATAAYLRRQAYGHGRSQRLAEALAQAPWSKSLAVLPGVLAKSLAGYALKHRFSRAKQRELIFDLGYAVEALQELFHPPATEPPPALPETP